MLLKNIHSIHLLPFFPFLLLAFFHWRFHGEARPSFDLDAGYERTYSKFRTAEARAFIDASVTKPFRRTTSTTPFLCVGMLTLHRPSGDTYFREAVASLLAGLNQEERNELYVMPFITHTDPTEHSVYEETWLGNVADRILLYNNSEILTNEELAHVRELESERRKTHQPDREKHLFDYGLLMKTCARNGAPYVAMFEDDILALDGWYHRTKAALQDIKNFTIEKKETSFLYLRLFYSETHPNLSTTLFNVIFVTAIVVILLRISFLGRQKWFVLIPVMATIFTLGAILYMEIVRSAQAAERLHPSVREMPELGCCAQGIVYPTEKTNLLTDWFTKNRIGFVDTLTEELADQKPEETGSRWSIRPAVLQHVGTKSSKGDNWGSDKPGQMSAAQGIWNFEFEKNDPIRLKAEHSQVVALQKLQHSDGVQLVAYDEVWQKN